jgi:hypothetical protein
MKKYLVILGCLVALVIAFGCQSDIVLPPDVNLVGTYTGTYSYITDYRGGEDEKITTAYVIFIFDETAYHMNLDTAFTDQDCFCAVDGQWALTEGVRLKEDNSVPDSDAGCNACNDEMNPEGVFVRETVADLLVLKLQEGTTLYMLRLKKISD